MPLAISIFLAVLDVCFFIGLLAYLDRMPKAPFVPQPPEEAHFTVAESLKVLAILNSEGQKTPKQLADFMGVSVQVVEAILSHMGKSDLVLLDIEQGIIPPAFRITPRGQEALH